MWTNPFRTLLGKESIADYSEMELTEINTAGELEELTLGEFDEEELNLNFEELGEDFEVQEPMEIIPQEQLPRPLDRIPQDDLELGEGYEVEQVAEVEYAVVKNCPKSSRTTSRTCSASVWSSARTYYGGRRDRAGDRGCRRGGR